MKFHLWLACTFLLGSVSAIHAQKKFTLRSPDKSVTLTVAVGSTVTYTVSQDNKTLIGSSVVSFNNSNYKVSKATQSSHQGKLTPVVKQKTAVIEDRYNELHIDFSNVLSLEWRAYDNGIAWHWISHEKGAYKVKDEQAEFNMDKAGKAWYPQEDGFYSHNERKYIPYTISEIGDNKLASLPALFEVNGTKLLITESGLYHYAGMWLRGGNTIHAVFPQYPKELKLTGDRDEQVVSRQDYIADLNGPQEFPWRVVMIARNDADLLTNQLVYQVAPEAKGDYSWVKPGKVQWDWWHYNNVYDVDFRAGINNDTYKYYIDFAAKNGIEYVLLDEGWCSTTDLFSLVPDINVKELVAYAKKRHVDILLWTSWMVLNQQMQPALDTFAAWGVKGIKVDFMQRDDQLMVAYYEKVATEAAKRHLLVDFHGAYKPIGWLRTHPNVLTSEGVLGNENSKFGNQIDPVHTTTLPFIRQAAGPMDFTPGGMLNVQKDAWSAQPAEPMTLGTRCNQLAMYVIFESPLQMLCDIPTHYIREPEAMELLSKVPVEWARTIPLQAKIGEYVVMARQALNGDWYIAGMTNWEAREVNVDLSFLPVGTYQMELWKDGLNADRNAKDFKLEKRAIANGAHLPLKLAQGGGFVIRLTK
ncbi:glycoside hydrolase family 97 protein [Chitinophaga sancti]|uniref:Alpha-glucosidase n=1 Tax=Chitinophaga sancti TaxID=1004 RepID=A0A1K1ML03_9BACT|nr:glycoside hydrolase family 97 protein [Chitinophaga sancti]WQD62775.1 glycoside hydrolase family 97 protein [Chitinophaga sancti]WQG91601.1 glycoside hydrolase family 97 protein [Chitinophaga sancti]SFW23769.1 alpha-glucosidase [Chitinophaga sancti]